MKQEGESENVRYCCMGKPHCYTPYRLPHLNYVLYSLTIAPTVTRHNFFFSTLLLANSGEEGLIEGNQNWDCHRPRRSCMEDRGSLCRCRGGTGWGGTYDPTHEIIRIHQFLAQPIHNLCEIVYNGRDVLALVTKSVRRCMCVNIRSVDISL